MLYIVGCVVLPLNVPLHFFKILTFYWECKFSECPPSYFGSNRALEWLTIPACVKFTALMWTVVNSFQIYKQQTQLFSNIVFSCIFWYISSIFYFIISHILFIYVLYYNSSVRWHLFPQETLCKACQDRLRLVFIWCGEWYRFGRTSPSIWTPM